MNIEREHTDALNAVLKVKLVPEDYKPAVDEALKKHARQMNMPGFRKGMVPVNLVKKMYGKSVLADELNRLVAESVDKYINEQNLQVLGNPMPKPENEMHLDLDKPSSYEFLFDLGLAPEVNISLPPAHQFTAYDITVSEKELADEVDRLRRRFGQYINPEVTDADCSVFGTFQELDAAGQPDPNGIIHQGFLLLSNVTDEAARNRFYGNPVGGVVRLNPARAISSEADVKRMLGINEGDISLADKEFAFTIERINKVEKAELDQALFDQVYGDGAVSDEAGFLDKIREEIAQGYRYEAEHSLKHEMEDVLLSAANLQLPDEFLRRWLKYSNEKITDEQLDKEYSQYARDLKWRLIENKIFRDQNFTITEEEIENYARTLLIDQYIRYGQAHMLTEDKLNDLTARYLKNSSSVQRVVENITGRKVFEYLNQIVSKNVKPIGHEEFVDLMSKHQHTHHH
jgi:trigger factor